MSNPAMDRIRAATATDATQLLALWELAYDDVDTDPLTTWKEHADRWFTGLVDERTTARFPVIEIDGDVVATRLAHLKSASRTRNATEVERPGWRTSSPCRSTEAGGTGLCWCGT